MDSDYLVDLRHLIDLSKVNVWIEISECMEYSNPVEGMNVLCSLLEWIHENFQGLKFYKIHKESFSSVIQKIEANRRSIIDFDRYIKIANTQLKKDKGLAEGDSVSVGQARKSFNITLQELVSLYKGLEVLEEEYELIKENIFILWNMSSYFKNVNSIKCMLEKRLTYALVNR